MSASNYHHIDNVLVLRATDRALFVRLPETEEWDEEETWIPRSQVVEGDEWEVGDEGTLSVTEWLARQRGWVEGE